MFSFCFVSNDVLMLSSVVILKPVSGVVASC